MNNKTIVLSESKQLWYVVDKDNKIEKVFLHYDKAEEYIARRY